MKDSIRAKLEQLADRCEEVARLLLEKLGANLTTLRPDQADYIGVPVEGPYKPEHYRY